MEKSMFRFSSSNTNSFKYRDRMTIVIDILKAVRNSGNGKRKTQIMQSANLNCAQMKRYLDYLTDRGLIRITDEESKFKITNKGFRFLSSLQIQEIQSFK